jgi:hypothetical protein
MAIVTSKLHIPILEKSEIGDNHEEQNHTNPKFNCGYTSF